MQRYSIRTGVIASPRKRGRLSTRCSLFRRLHLFSCRQRECHHRRRSKSRGRLFEREPPTGWSKRLQKMRSEAHCPGLPTVDYFTTSPGGIPTPTGRIPYPCSVASVGGFLRSQPNFRGAHSLCLYGDTGWWLASRWQPPPWLCRLLANRIRHQKQLSQFPVRVLALSALPAVSCSATHKQMKERVRT